MLADITIFDKAGSPALLVEVKGKRGTTRQWAAELRRNLLVHGFLSKAPFFLIATPDRFYLWKNEQNASALREPDYEEDASAVFGLEGLHNGNEYNETPGLELRVGAWLAELLGNGGNGSYPVWVKQSELDKAIENGRLAFEAAA